MQGKRTTKEFTLSNTEPFKVKFGTVMKDCPRVIYTHSKAKIKPNALEKDYTKQAQAIKSELSKYVEQEIKNIDCIAQYYIFSCQVSENGLSFNKISNIKYSLFVKPKVVKPIKEYKDTITTIVEHVNKKLISLCEEKNMTIS